MKKRTVTAIICAFLAAAVLSGTALAAGTGSPVYVNTLELADGFTLTDSISYNGSGKRVESFALEAATGSPVYPVVFAEDKVYSTMTVTEMTDWAKSQGWNVYGAINADFFYGTMSLPLGGVIQDGEYISSMNGENLLAFTDEGAIVSQAPQVKLTLTNNGGATAFGASNRGKTVEVSHLNKVRTAAGGIFLYTSAYHDKSTNTNLEGWGVRFKVLSPGKLTVSGSLELEVVDVTASGTDYALGDGYMVLTAQKDNAASAGVYESFSVGDRVTLTAQCSDDRLVSAKWACGCGDVLVENGSMTDPAGWDKALKDPHPRTAFGIKADGSLVAYAIDGRSSSYSNGSTLEELAEDLIGRGCVTAANLDGGGSTVMAVRMPGSDRCTVINKPSGGSPRKCSSYILFVSDILPDGAASRLFLKEDGAMVMTGSSIPLTFAAADRSGAPAALNGEVEVSGGLGSVTDGVYTAGLIPGTDTVTLSSGSASGRGSIHVVDSIDSVAVTDAATGKEPALSAVEPGETVQLSVSGQKLTRKVWMDNLSVSYSVTGDVGTISPDGLFTAAQTPGVSGEIYVSVGGVTSRIPVTVKNRLVDISSSWAKDYIQTLFDRGIVNGVGDNMYMPNQALNRCDFVLMLWRAMDSPELNVTCPFTDVKQDAYYYDAVKWSQSVGIITGTGDGTTFSPTSPLSREQAFTIIYRLLLAMRTELPEPGETALSSYSDAGEISGFAKDAVSSLTEYGLVTGNDGKCFPTRSMNRAEMAKVLCVALFE